MKTNRELIAELDRLSRAPTIPLEAIIDYIPDEIAEEVSANISETFAYDIFKHIMPGLERAIIVLRSQEYTYSEIGWILGMPPDEVSRVMYKVKNRLLKIGYKDLTAPLPAKNKKLDDKKVK